MILRFRRIGNDFLFSKAFELSIKSETQKFKKILLLFDAKKLV